MIRLFVFSLLAIVIALWVTLYLGFPGDPGYLLIAFGNYTFETSLFALLVAMAVIYLLVRLLMLVLQWINPMKLLDAGRVLSKNRKAKRRSHTIEGLLSFTRGNWSSSLNQLRKGMRDNDASVINYLAAAYAAFQVGDKEGWVSLLEQAGKKYPTAHSTIDSLKAQLYHRSGQLEQSLAVLQEMKKNSVNDVAMLTLLKEVYVQLADWKSLSELLPVLERNKVLDDEELLKIRKRLFMEELYATFEKVKAGSADMAALRKQWKKGAAFADDEKVVRHYADLLLQVDEGDEAAKVIETALNKRWNQHLVRFYGEKILGNTNKQLLVAENWVQSRPADGELLLSLGRLSMRNQLWGKAREYYEASIKITPSAEAYGELGRLLKQLGDEEAGEACLESYSNLLGATLPGLPMPVLEKRTH
jgi:HemY protein